jgi:hypothetical protein
LVEEIVDGESFAVDATIIRQDASQQKGIEHPEKLNEGASRAIGEYLAVLDAAAFGAAAEVPPKFVSPTDPAA